MNVFGMFKSWLNPATVSPSWAAAAGFHPTSSASSEPTPENLQGLAAVHACVRLISSALAGVDFHLTERLPGGGKRIIKSGDAAAALELWPFDEKERWIADALVTGNGILKLHTNGRGGIVELERLDPARVAVAFLEGGSVIYEVAERLEYQQRAETLPPEKIAHLRYSLGGSGQHPLIGISPLAAVAPSLALVLRIHDTARALYQNLSGVNVILRHPKTLSGDAAQRLKTAFGNATKDGNRFNAVILQENMEVQTIEPAKALDMQLSELMELSVLEVARAFSVPPSLLALTDSVSYSSSVEQARAFSRFTLKPWLQRISDVLTRALVTRENRLAGFAVTGDIETLTRGDGAELAEVASKLANSGVLSTNETRSWFGMSDVPSGEIVRIPVNTQPIETWANSGKPDKPSEARVQSKRVKRALNDGN